jgi:exopolysaccharide biosynthesis polyprenyl glycosylphosphotransferase
MLGVERKRSERSGRRFLLLLIRSDKLLRSEAAGTASMGMTAAVCAVVRDTDCAGWYEDQSVLGVIFTELGEPAESVSEAIVTRMTESLRVHLGASLLNQVTLTIHLFPEVADAGPAVDTPSPLSNAAVHKHGAGRVAMLTKRSMDVVGSISMLLVLSPLLLLVAIAVKLTSKGPILFRQQRVGLHGELFTFLKFRSMYVNNDPKIHQEFVARFIAGESNGTGAASAAPVFKLTNDPRVTKLGRLLRATSIDELPQLFNVLAGQMALVGPRPPLPYEYNRYNAWHRRRNDVKPGITGLWQVTGRSRTTFDEMVRLDLKYAREWSVWTDLKILLQTPRAVLSGDGAY